MANFLSFDVYDIDLSKVMNNSNLNFVLLQTTRKSIIVVEDLDLFLTEKWMVTGGVSGRSGRGWETPNTHLFLKNKNKIKK
jgi:hypothetical protein